MYQGRSSAFEIADFAAKNGVGGVELMSFCDELREPDMVVAKEIGRFVKQRNLAMPCFSTAACLVFEEKEEYIKRLKKYAEICSELEIPYLHHTVASFFGRKDSDEERDEFLKIGAESTVKVNEYAKSLGVKTIIEDQGYLFNGVWDFKKFREYTGGVTGTLLDTGNIIFVDQTASEFGEAFRDSICHVHIKDYFYVDPNDEAKAYTSMKGKRFRGCPLGEGIVDFPKVASLLDSINYDGYFAIELEGAESPSDFIVAMEYIEKTFS